MNKILLSVTLIFSFLTLKAQWVNYDNSTVTEIQSNEIRSVAIDDEGTLWFGTYDGLISFDGEEWNRYSNEDNNLAGNQVNEVKFNTGEGSLLLSTNNGSNEISLEGGFLVLSTYRTENSGIYDDVVYSSGVNPDGIRAYGTARGLSVFTSTIWTSIQDLAAIDSINLANNPVTSIHSTAGNTFISTDGKGIYLTANETDGLSFVTNWVSPYNIPVSDQIKATVVDAQGNQWYGTDNGAVFHSGIESQQGWGTPITTVDGLPDNQVNAIIEDSNGNVWFGTENGLAVKMADETWSAYSMEDGLIDNRINDLVEGNDKRIWIVTESGISVFTPPWVETSIRFSSAYFGLTVHPNPVENGTWIKYNIPEAGPLNVSVYDISGKMIRVLKDEFGVTGQHEIFWNIHDNTEGRISPGIYFIRIQSRNRVSSQKIIVL